MARALREAIHQLLQAITAQRPADSGTVDAVDAAAARPGPALHLQTDGRLTLAGGLDAALAELAHECLTLIDSPDRDRLTWCAGQRSTRAFIDRSPVHNRRWCDMTSCGDRAKVAAHRRGRQR